MSQCCSSKPNKAVEPLPKKQQPGTTTAAAPSSAPAASTNVVGREESMVDAYRRPSNPELAQPEPSMTGAYGTGTPAAPTMATAVAALDHSVPLSVVIFGATGDLARKKLFPALYQLILLGHLPKTVNIIGFGRRDVDLPAFIAKQCAVVKPQPGLAMEDYTALISFNAGGSYDGPDGYVKLDAKLKEYEGGKPGNRLFFLSVPPTVFGAVSEQIAANARVVEGAFTRLIIEKPFGKDSGTFEELNACTSSLFEESQLYRIDHYLGKARAHHDA
jgi:glucose-6-phosphate 1-dehydrogenase